MRIVFRTDASPQIGTGHVFRCLALAAALKRLGAQVEFVCRAEPRSLPDALVAQDILIRSLPPSRIPASPDGSSSRHWLGASTGEDATATLESIAAGERPAWLVVDHYALDAQWESLLRGAVDRLAVIDDLGNRLHDCDLLIDQNFGAETKGYQALVPVGCRLLLGPAYALLREEFPRLRGERRERNGDLSRLLVFFGGSDVEGHSLTALEALRGLVDLGLTTDIVVGKYNPHLPRLEALCATLPATTLHVQTTRMAALMAEADLMLCAGGITTWERCCLGLPGLTVCTAENQIHPATSMAEAGLSVHLGWAADVSAETLRHALRTLAASPWLLRAIGRNSAALVDGRGAERIAKAMSIRWINLRRATEDDCTRLFEWRNDPEVRRYSIDSRPLEFAAHEKWFAAVIRAEDRVLLIGNCDGIDIGVIRFDVEGSKAILSVYLRPGYFGRGYGALLIDAGSRWVRENCAGVARVLAEVKTENIASSRAFEAAGYVRHALVYQKELNGD